MFFILEALSSLSGFLCCLCFFNLCFPTASMKGFYYLFILIWECSPTSKVFPLLSPLTVSVSGLEVFGPNEGDFFFFWCRVTGGDLFHSSMCRYSLSPAPLAELGVFQPLYDLASLFKKLVVTVLWVYIWVLCSVLPIYDLFLL